MKTCEAAYNILCDLSTKRAWSREWIDRNWDASYDCGYDDGKRHEAYSHTSAFLEEGSLACAETGWFWYPYFMGLRDALGDIGHYD